MLKQSGLTLIFFFFISFQIQAEIIVPDEVRDQIITDVIAEARYLDQALVEKRISLWIYDQPQPESSEAVTDSGNCNSSCVQSGGNVSFPMPRNVKLKSKNSDDNLSQNVVIKWKRPQALSDGSNYYLKSYKVIVSKNGETFNKYKIKTKYKNNGKPIKHQKLKLRGLEEANYEVQVRAVYKPASQKTAAKNIEIDTESVNEQSPWTDSKGGVVSKHITQVRDLSWSTNLHYCLLNNAYATVNKQKEQANDQTYLADIHWLECSNQGLNNDEINLIGTYLVSLAHLDISNNPNITDISPITDSLTFLESLNLNFNTGIDLTIPNNALTTLDGLEYVYLVGLNLSKIPMLPDGIVYIDVSQNLITDNALGYWPSNPLIALEVNNNRTSWQAPVGDYSLNDQFFEGLSGLEIKTLKAKGSLLTDVSILSDVVNLDYLDIESDNLEYYQNFGNFSGFCGLSLKGKDIDFLLGERPVQYLNLSDNPKLYFDEFSSNGNYLPVSSNYLNSNNMDCQYHNNIEDSQAPILTDMGSVPPFTLDNGNQSRQLNCPVVRQSRTLIHAVECVPPKVAEFKVYEDQRTGAHILNWVKDPSHDYERWGVESYKVLFYDQQNNLVNSQTIGVNQPNSLTLFGQNVTSYEFRACTDYQCGLGHQVHSISFEEGLSKVIDVEVVWSGLDSNSPQFKFTFNYPEELLEPIGPTSGDPESFHVETEFVQDNGSTELEVIPLPSGNTTAGWETVWFNYNDMVGNSYRITACNSTVGCGVPHAITFGAPVTSENIPQPIWSTTGVTGNTHQIGEHKQIVLEWSYSNARSGKELNLIDYVEVTEWSPRKWESQVFKSTYNNALPIKRIFFVNGNKTSITLDRLSFGDYDFSLRACHRDRVNGDVCSQPSGQFDTDNPDINMERNDVQWSYSSPNDFRSEGWYLDDTSMKKHVVWNYYDHPVYKPDYFIIQNTDFSSNHSCNFDSIRINFADSFKDTNNMYWSTEKICEDMGSQTWQIKSCVNGVGCGHHVTVNTSDTNNQIPNINPSRTTPSIGGPGDLATGMWMNSEQSGIGWHFYWASQLRHDSSDYDKYGRAYDLIAYWLTYQQIEGHWTPVWFESELKQVNGDINGSEAYFEGQLYYHKKDSSSGEFEKINAGVLQVLIGNTNREAKLRMKLHYSDGILFSPDSALSIPNTKVPGHPYVIDDSDGFIELEIEDIAVHVMQGGNPNGPYEGRFGDKNDVDHFAGVYQLDPSENGFSPLTMLTSIDRELEITSLAMFDSDGIPVWVQGSTCGSDCTQPVGEYFDGYDQGLAAVLNGFDPLGPVPDGYVLNDNVINIGYLGRCFADGITNYSEPDRFKKAKVTIDLNGALIYNNVDNTTYERYLAHNNMQGGISCNDSAMGGLVKRASLHDIRYFVNGNNENVTQCDPNDANGPGICDIKFTWFTDDDFIDIEPYYTDDDWATSHKLDELCPGVPSGQYVTTQFECVISEAGNYQFQLRKNTYDENDNGTVVIAESNPLLIAGCNTPHCTSTLGAPAVPPIPASQVNSIAPIPGNDTVGSTTGAFDVDENGAANYTIPIFAPKGRGGLAPQLALSYNSNASNGIAGVGWNITGVSAITRCLKSVEHDPGIEKLSPIKLNNEDAFCIDGVRLYPENGLNGENETTYRTEIDSFAKVESLSLPQNGNGPGHFKIWTKNGEIRTYGSNSDNYKANKIFEGGTGAQIIANKLEGASNGFGNVVQTWLISKIEDRNGNSIWFQWDTKEGENYLSYVKWADPTDGSHHYELEFDYDKTLRSDAFEMYDSRVHLKMFKKLNFVKTSIREEKLPASPMQEVRRLKLSYDYSNNGQARVDSITECIDESTCLSPLEFEWDNNLSHAGINGPLFESNQLRGLGKLGIGGGKLIDINGDGVSEFVFIQNYDQSSGNPIVENLEARYYVAFHETNHTSFTGNDCEISSGYWNLICDMGIKPYDLEDDHEIQFRSDSWFVFDFNDDGYQDIMTPVYGSDNWQIFYSNGFRLCKFELMVGCEGYAPKDTGINNEGFPYTVVGGNPRYLNKIAGLQDMTGDALADLVVFTELGIHDNDNEIPSFTIIPQKITEVTQDIFEIGFAETLEHITVEMPIEDLYPVEYMCNTWFCNNSVPEEGDSVLIWDVRSTNSDFNGDGYSDLIISYLYYRDDSEVTPCDIYLRECYTDVRGIFSYHPAEDSNTFPRIKLEHLIGNESLIPNAKSIQAIDINGDGLSDVVFSLGTQSEGESWYYQINRGFNNLNDDRMDFTDPISFNLEPVTDLGTLEEETDDEFNRKHNVHFLDYDHDGDIDILYPQSHSESNVYVYYKIRKYNHSNPYSISEFTGIVSGLPDGDANENVNLFADFNGDGFTDHFRLFRNEDNKKQQVKFSSNPWKPRNKITSFVQNLGSKKSRINVLYESATLPTVYTKQVGSTTDSAFQNIGESSPVFDLMLPQYLVRKVDKSMPIQNDAGHMSSMYYHYKGLRVQGGGRGQLGFEEAVTYDVGHSIMTKTTYRQDFPFIGMPDSTFSYYVDQFDETAAISGNEVVPENPVCHPVYNQLNCDDPILGQTIETRTLGESKNQYSSINGYNNANTKYPFLQRSTEKSYDLIDTEPLKTIINEFEYGEPLNAFFGNLTSSNTYVCKGMTPFPELGESTDSVCSFVNNNAVKITSTFNTYYDSNTANQENWILGRLKKSTTTSSRQSSNEVLTVSKSSGFQYYSENGQLKEEKINSNSVHEQLRTRYIYDEYGQVQETFQCSSHLSSDQSCESVPTIGRPIDNTFIHRYSKTEYDQEWDEYVENTYEPFTHGYDRLVDLNINVVESVNFNLTQDMEGEVDLVSMGEIITRDVYGQPIVTTDIFGQTHKTVFGKFGEQHASANSKGETAEIYRYWCEDTGAPYFCPSNAAMVVITYSAGTPTQKVFSDILGREIRSQTQHFKSNEWQTTDTYYDELGRTIKQSEPFLLREQDGSQSIVSPKYYTETEYDDLDRVILIKSPSHCVEDISQKFDPNITPSCLNDTSVYTYTSYDGLTVSTLNPNGQLNTQVFDETGQIIQVRDSLDNPIDYEYGALDNLTSTTSYLNSLPIKITMGYDDFGRKTSMQDPDKGDWSYKYNALGELIKQTKVGDDTSTETYYDIRGRKFFLKEPGVRSFWEYDLYSNYGLLVSEHARGELTSKGFGQSKFYYYDEFGRVVETDIDVYDGRHGESISATYITTNTYDQYGRIFQHFDATGNGVLYRYNSQGYQYAIQDAANGYDGQKYNQTISLNARGQVLEQKLHDQFHTYRSYLSSNGFLENILTIDSQGLVVQDQNFAYDKIGNLIRRSDLILDYESGIQDPIQTETFIYDELNRLTVEKYGYAGDPIYSEKDYVYDASGNLKNKDGVVLHYLGEQPHAVSNTSDSYSYQYDDFGNMYMRTNGDETLAITYAHFDKPTEIHRTTGYIDVKSEIAYGANRSRYVRLDTKPGVYSKITHYIGSVELIERISNQDAPIEFKRTIGNLAIDGDFADFNRNAWDYNYLLKDHIGSTHAVVNKQGQMKTRMSFNSWGERRQAPYPQIQSIYQVYSIDTLWSDLGVEIEDTTNRGFTGHEHFDELGIIHMNGRIYDPVIGKFLQADPIIQEPYNTQSLNRYSYVMNNPLSFSDPTGYARLRDGWWRLPAAILISVATSGAASGAIANGTAASGAVSSAAIGKAFTISVAGGAAAGAVASGNLKGATRGAIIAALTFGIGHGGGNADPFFDKAWQTGLAHATVSGISAELDGGKFGHGFASAGLSMLASNYMGDFFETGNAGLDIVSNAILQGTISELTGGKFANGAITGAFRMAYNHSIKMPMLKKLTSSPSKVNNLKILGDNEYKAKVAAVEAKALAAGITVFDELRNAPTKTYIRQSEFTRFSEINDEKTGALLAGVIDWDGDAGITAQINRVGRNKFANLSPASGLIHEAGHAWLSAVIGITGDHGNHEMKIINGIEAKWGKFVGEPLRLNHGGILIQNRKLFQSDRGRR